MLKTITAIVALFFLAGLSACGGGDDEPRLDESTARALMASFTGPAGCVSLEAYQTLISWGSLKPLPAERPAGSIWSEPFLLVPAVDQQPFEWAPGRFATPVVIQGPSGPMNIKGPFYVPGELPAYVCGGGT